MKTEAEMLARIEALDRRTNNLEKTSAFRRVEIANYEIEEKTKAVEAATAAGILPTAAVIKAAHKLAQEMTPGEFARLMEELPKTKRERN